MTATEQQTNKLEKKKTLSQEQLEKIKKMRQEIAESSNYVKFADGDKKIFYFDADKWSVIYKKFDGSKFEESSEPKEGYNKTWRFDVYDPNDQQDKTWDVTGGKTADKILEFMENGILFLKIKRIGKDKTTVYDVEEPDTS